MNDKSRSNPPKWPLRFLRWFCKKEYIDEIEGDILELFYSRVAKSRIQANAFLFWNILRSLRWINFNTTQTVRTGLWKNYFKVGVRALVKDRKFTVINLFGLSLGLSVFLTIVLLVKHELSFDSFHSKGDRIYQVIQVHQNANGDDPEIWTSWQLAKALSTDLDIVENAVTIHSASATWTEAGGKRFFEEDGIVAGAQFFEIFDFELAKGNENEVLRKKRSIILTESLARKYFEFENPIGKEVALDFYGRFTVTGILKDVPTNSYIQFDFIISQDYDVFLENVSDNFRKSFYSWTGDPVATYVLLKNSEDETFFEAKVAMMLEKYLSKEQVNKHYLLGLLDLHFHSDGIDGRVNEYVKGDLSKVQFLLIVGSIILLMACFNYISISTARYIKRTKEVGVRKAMGAHSKQVAIQFLIESFILVLISFVVGMMLTYYLLPYFYSITGIQLELTTTFLVDSLPYLILIIFLVTLLAGFYPAFHLSRYAVVNVLKNMALSHSGNDRIRRSLVVVQYLFVISILAGLVIVNGQYNYLNNKSLGFKSEELIVVEINSGEVRDSYESIKQEMLGVPGVSKVSGITRMISGYRSGASVRVAEPGVEEYQPMNFFGLDDGGISKLGMQVIQGQSFSGNESQDSISIILNQTAADMFGGVDVIGNYLEVEEIGDDMLRAKVIGIVKDFHFESFHRPIGPIVLGYYKNPLQSLDDILIWLEGDNKLATLEAIEAIHDSYDRNEIMTWEFMDDMAKRSYEKELIFRDLFIGASLISFLITILGLIGLSSYSILSRRKEMAIRKILGAEFFSLMYEHARDFVRYLLTASVISIPICWWLSNQWLMSFAYRINVSPMMYLGVLLFILLITALVILFVGSRTIKSNPVKAIKYE